MTIRTRLLILLLGTALVPLAITSLSHQVSLHMARARLTANAQRTLAANAERALAEKLAGYVEVLLRDKRLVQSLLERQVREIELALAGGTTGPAVAKGRGTFGLDPQIQVPSELYHPCFQDPNDSNLAALAVDYCRQSYVLAPDVVPEEAGDYLAALAPLTSVFRGLYAEAPAGTLWLTTRLKGGCFTRYPAARESETAGAAGVPPRPRRGGPPRFGGPRPGVGPRRTPLVVDPATKQATVVVSLPVHDAQGRVVGSTALVRTIPEIFSSLSLPELWGPDVERMLIQVDPNQTDLPAARVLLRDAPETPPLPRRRIMPRPLRSPDTAAFRALIQDIAAGQAGVRTLSHAGRDYLWAYHPLDVQDVAALLLVPMDQITALAQRVERSLFQGGLTAMEITSGVFLLTAMLAIGLAVRRARRLTQPIGDLIEAGQRLGRGDYSARVRIRTGDELEELGEVFNRAGPKLHEHARMKSALALAGAVQQNLLPKETPRLENFDVAGQCLFCDETGGDCYDFVDLSAVTPQRHGIVLGDVSGHGIGAALLMAAVRGSLQAEAKHHSHDLAELMAELNQQVVRDTEADRFVTLFYGILDGPARSLVWAAAGHEPALWYHAETDRFEELPNTGLPVGVVASAAYEQAGPIVLTPGDLLIVGTDGIREARNRAGEEFGRERLCATLRRGAGHSADRICRAVIKAVLAFLGDAPRQDDITLVVVKTR